MKWHRLSITEVRQECLMELYLYRVAVHRLLARRLTVLKFTGFGVRQT